MPAANIIATPEAKLRSLNSAGGMNGRLRGDHVDNEQIDAEAAEHRLDDDLAAS